MIGKGEEPISVIDQLFDTETLKDRPNYDFADGNNLILSDCGFEGISWKNHNFLSDFDTYSTVKDQLMTASIDLCLFSVLHKYYLDSMVKTNFIEQDSKGIITILPGQKISKERPEEKHRFREILPCIKVQKKSDKKKEDYIKHNRKKNGDFNQATSLTIIQKAYNDALNERDEPMKKR